MLLSVGSVALGVVFAKPGGDVIALYAPMAVWGPLLILIALDYRRRRRVC